MKLADIMEDKIPNAFEIKNFNKLDKKLKKLKKGFYGGLVSSVPAPSGAACDGDGDGGASVDGGGS